MKGFSTIALFLLAFSIQAAVHNVSVDGSGFSPSELSIQVGDTVIWENVDESEFPHTTTSTLPIFNPDYWNGFLVGFEDTFSHTFNNPGSFTYTDQTDFGTGTITVNTGFEPLIQLESPRTVASQFIFDATGLTPGKMNVLQTSTNLITWLSDSTNTATSPSMTFTNAAVGIRFFRVVELP